MLSIKQSVRELWSRIEKEDRAVSLISQHITLHIALMRDSG